MRKAATIANTILAGAGLACLLVLAYFVYHYGWAQDRTFSSWVGVLLYYGAPAAGAIALFSSLRLRPEAKVNLAFLLCSTVFCVYLLEVALTVWGGLPSVMNAADRREIVAAARASGVDYDRRSKSEVVRDLRARGTDAQPAMAASVLLDIADDGTSMSRIRIAGDEVVPLAGMSNRATVLCNESGEYVVYESDRHGFNNPAEAWTTLPVEIVAVGDSFTHGHCVPADKNYVAEIRRAIPATLNLGMQGNGPLVMLATLREYAAPLQPPVVLWFHFGNDLWDLRREESSAVLRRYRTEDGFRQQLAARQEELDAALSVHIEQLMGRSSLSIWTTEIVDALGGIVGSPGAILRALKLGELRTTAGLVQGRAAEAGAPQASPGQASPPQIFARFAETLSAAHREVESWGGQLYFVYLPGADMYMEGVPPDPDRPPVLEIVQRQGLPVIDLHEVFAAHPDPLGLFPFRLPKHYSEEGHRLVAEAVLRRIGPRP